MKFYLTHLNKELDRQRGITEPANPHPDPNAAHAAQGDQHKHHAEEGMDALDRAAQLRGLSTEMAWQARSNFRYLV